jgi:alpha-tubulin suppressor-like RCC1 family protein
MKSVSAGYFHTCGVTEGGGAKCWGSNTWYQLGDGTMVNSLVPVDVVGLSSGVAAIYAGYRFTCALTTGGGVKCWGTNVNGQLGDGSTTTRSSPVDVVGLTSGVASLRVGYAFACAVLTTGGTKCWGRNNYGQLGRGNTTDSSTPVDVTGLTSGVESISTGYYHACALLSSGGAKCWGYNYLGRLGDGTTTNRSSPVDVLGLTSGLKQVEATYAHSCAMFATGALKCWGYNGYGQLGDGTITDRLSPVDVTGYLNPQSKLVLGNQVSCAVNTAGTETFCWGENFYGQLGEDIPMGRLRPTPVSAANSGVESLANPNGHNCAVISGSAKCWGSNEFGGLGDGTLTQRTQPTQVVGLATGVTAIATSSSGFSCAITTAGTVKCWGKNDVGQLGDGTTANRNLPVDVLGVANVQKIKLGSSHVCILTTGGAVQCWGSNTYGQLGNSSTTSSSAAVDVTGLSSGVSDIQAGNTHTCALTTGGGVKCWGRNNYGQLGDSSTSTRTSPVDTTGLTSGVASISAVSSGDHGCAVTTTGAAKCWGYNAINQLGDGTASNRTSPVNVVGLASDVVAVSVGYAHSCAILTGGLVKCWGYHSFGQLGNDNTAYSHPTAIDVVGLPSAALTLSCGLYSSCAVLTSGAAYCWGSNGSGQLGDGTKSTEYTPVRLRIYE